MNEDIKELAGKIIGIVKDRTGDFLEQNQDAKEFLQERAERLAQLMLRLGRADASEVPLIQHDIAMVKQSVENEIATVAIHAAIETRTIFKEILGVIFEVAQKALPTLLTLL